MVLRVANQFFLSITFSDYFEVFCDNKHTQVGENKLNRITLIGNVGRDPEMRYFESGKCKTSFSIAVRRTKEITDWVNIECWGKTAEIAAEYLRKGNKVGIDGSLFFDSYEKDGKTVQRPYVNASQVHLIDKKNETQINDDELPF